MGGELIVARDRQLPLEPLKEMRVPVGEVDDKRGQAARVKADPQDVDRGLEQCGVDVDNLGERKTSRS